MNIADEIEKLAVEPSATGWVPRPGFDELRRFLQEMNERGLVVKHPYNLPLPDYNGLAPRSTRQESGDIY